MQELSNSVKQTVKDLYNLDVEPELSRPEEQFGDFSTNVALQLAGKLNKKPRQIAEALVVALRHPDIAKAEIAGPGFINIWLTDAALIQSLGRQPAKKYTGQSVVVEYSDPNPFKELHVGHLYDGILGDAIANLFEGAGAKVHRV